MHFLASAQKCHVCSGWLNLATCQQLTKNDNNAESRGDENTAQNRLVFMLKMTPVFMLKNSKNSTSCDYVKCRTAACTHPIVLKMTKIVILYSTTSSAYINQLFIATIDHSLSSSELKHHGISNTAKNSHFRCIYSDPEQHVTRRTSNNPTKTTMQNDSKNTAIKQY